MFRSLGFFALLVSSSSFGQDGGKPQPTSTAQPTAAVAPGEVADFTAEAKLLFRVVACAGETPLPPTLDAPTIDAHCKALGSMIDRYRKTWVEVAQPFIGKVRPPALPSTVVYPFGGGDLISAITTYPDARDYTTMSLEHAGDPRRIHKLSKEQLASSLQLIRKTSAGLLLFNDSKTESLMKGQRGELPGQLSFFLIALAVHGYEPVQLRYIRVASDGAVQHLTHPDIGAREPKQAQLLKAGWVSPDFSEAFTASELLFTKKGDASKATKVHRHFAVNLDNDHFGKDPALQAYLAKKGRIVAMTKAASYLLWRDAFSAIRDYLLGNMDFMVSDSTGIPPRFAAKAGFVQETYGQFEQSFLGAAAEHNDGFRKLWKEQPARELPFRYGYIDGAKHFHMLVTKKGLKGG